MGGVPRACVARWRHLGGFLHVVAWLAGNFPSTDSPTQSLPEAQTHAYPCKKSARYCCPISTKLECANTFCKVPNAEFHEISFSGSELLYGDRQTRQLQYVHFCNYQLRKWLKIVVSKTLGGITFILSAVKINPHFEVQKLGKDRCLRHFSCLDSFHTEREDVVSLSVLVCLPAPHPIVINLGMKDMQLHVTSAA
jgi:hypothetical protein